MCEYCGGQCTWDHLELHYVTMDTIPPVQWNTYLIRCRACHWYIHAMMISPPQQRALTEQRAPGRKRIFHSILREKKLNYSLSAAESSGSSVVRVQQKILFWGKVSGQLKKWGIRKT